MIAYQMVGTNDLQKAKTFYDAVLEPLGAKPAFPTPHGQAYTAPGAGLFFAVTEPYDEQSAAPGNGTMTAFGAPNLDVIKAVHAKAIEMGGTCEGEPGPRGEFGEFAYFRDLDGNKMCIACLKTG